ncbi:Endoribonuclease L-PSP [Aspergillus uvarum CBS 121591]|uniref:Endoribonuclease L-PSP n=1 Tax=Aspergillus uvarum CBS 121591 TaxID=1448315 RepID=A0A319CIU1_9EURO|nr:Endoribonuclease L-PSP [Aspergillus uvarum CBS 121591]PYH83137.1 Endoribonuclease L-PSP [Aspergillus uvarum CBS 121591]
MSYREPVYTSEACAPLPQFSQAIKYNGLVYCSGTVGTDPVTDELVPGTVTNRARMALRNLQAVLEAAGSSLDRVVKANVFLTDMNDFERLNIAWDEFFPVDPKPCRTCVAVHQLPLNTDVEIEMIASYGEN